MVKNNPQSREQFTLGIDIGGTKINLVLVDSNGHLLYTHKSLICPSKEPTKVTENISSIVQLCFDEIGLNAEAIGVGVAGQVDRKGVVLYSPNLGWRNFPLKRILEEKSGLPVMVTNDVRAAAWGEWSHGSGRGINDLVVLFVGTGIGGGVISDGRVLCGCGNIGGELGHTTLIVDGKKCRCPNNGCLEAYAGGWAIAQEAIKVDPTGGKRLLDLAGSIENIDSSIVGRAYHEGDRLSKFLVEETGKYLTAGVVSIVNIFDPCLLILGGGVIEGIPELVNMVRDGVRNRALGAVLGKLNIVKSKLGVDAGAIGAAFLAQSST